MNTSPQRVRIHTTDGLHLSALVEGRSDGPTLVLVHGYPDNLHVWDAVVASLKARYRIVRYDVRGAGLSDAPPGIAGYRFAQLTADFRRVIDHFSPDAPVHLVGHDWGSIQGWHFATEAALAGRISGFTTLSGPCFDHVGYQLRERGVSRATLRQLAASWYMGAFHLPLLAPAVWTLGLARHWPRVLARIERKPRFAAHPRQATQRRDGVNGINLYRANLLPHLLRPRPRHAIAPVQLVVATRDPFVTRDLLEGLERWAPQLSRAQVEAGHWLPLTQPEWLAAQIVRFNTQLPVSRS